MTAHIENYMLLIGNSWLLYLVAPLAILDILDIAFLLTFLIPNCKSNRFYAGVYERVMLYNSHQQQSSYFSHCIGKEGDVEPLSHTCW